MRGGSGDHGIYIDDFGILRRVYGCTLVFSESGNLLTSSAVCAYGTYLAYTAIGEAPFVRMQPVLGTQARLDALGYPHPSFHITHLDVEDGGRRRQYHRPRAGRGARAPQMTRRKMKIRVKAHPAGAHRLPRRRRPRGRDVQPHHGAGGVLRGLYDRELGRVDKSRRHHVCRSPAAKLWMQIAAQWVMFLTYEWTLVAPCSFLIGWV